MKWPVLLLLLSSLLLAGCSGHTHSSVSFASVSSGGSVVTHIEGGSGLAALLGITVIAAGIIESERGRYAAAGASPPELDPTRRVSEQDCSKPLDFSRGNIRCK
jgi:hypothetical protein